MLTLIVRFGIRGQLSHVARVAYSAVSHCQKSHTLEPVGIHIYTVDWYYRIPIVPEFTAITVIVQLVFLRANRGLLDLTVRANSFDCDSEDKCTAAR